MTPHRPPASHVWDTAGLDPLRLAHRLETLVRAMPDMMFRLSGDGVILEAKPGADADFLVPAEQFLGRSIADVLPTDVTEATRAAIRSAHEHGVVPRFEYSLRTPGGRRSYEARVVAVDPGEAVVIVRDITTRRAAEADLSTYLDLSPDLVAIAGFDGMLLQVNPLAWQETLGWSEAELLGRPYLSFVHPHDVAATEAAARALAAGQEVVGFVNRYMTTSVGYRCLEWRARPVEERQALIAVARDTTESRRAHRRTVALAELSAASLTSLADAGALAESITRMVSAAIPGEVIVDLGSDDPGSPEPCTGGAVTAPHRIQVPVVTEAGTPAALTVTRDPDGLEFTDAETELLAEIARNVGLLVDRMRLHQRLLETAELVASADLGIAKLTLDGIVASWNPAAERITARAAADVVGHPVRALFGERLAREADDGFAPVRQRDLPVRFEETGAPTGRADSVGRRLAVPHPRLGRRPRCRDAGVLRHHRPPVGQDSAGDHGAHRLPDGRGQPGRNGAAAQ